MVLWSQYLSFKYIGLQFHQSGATSHVIQPIQAKAGGSWATPFLTAVWQDLHLQLLHTVLVPVMQYGCEIWGMQSPRVAAANDARLALQCLYDSCIGIICDLRPSTPRRMMLAEWGLLPSQVFWWRRALPFWDSLAALPANSIYHTLGLDNLSDVFQGGVLAIWRLWQRACSQ